MESDRTLRIKLLQLECHFTWALKKEDVDVKLLLNKLEEQICLELVNDEGLARTYSALAYVQFLLGCLEDAHKSLATSVELHMKRHEDEFHKSLIVAYGNLAWLNYHMKNYPECVRYLEKLQQITGRYQTEFSYVPEVLGEQGWAFLKFSHQYYEKARECFRKALELEPDEGEWNTGYAIALYRTEFESDTCSLEDSPTIKQLRRAIDTNPGDDVLKVLLSLRLLFYKRYQEAEGLVEKALERSPDHPHVMRYVGKFFRNRGSVDRSVALLQKALTHSPNSSFIHHQLALCYKLKKIQLLQEQSHHARGSRIQQIRDLCIYHLEKATSLTTSFISAMSDLALLYGERGDMSRAEELFQVTFQTAQQKNDSLHVVSFYYAEFQQYWLRCESEAIKYYKECLKMSPKTIEGKRSYASLKKIAEKMILNNPCGEAYGILGFLHKEKGEKLQAIECYEKALSYGDNDEFLSNLCALRLPV